MQNKHLIPVSAYSQKQELQEKSQARVKNWPNTIQALRKKKDDARFEKFQKEEEERRKIDEEEAKYQAEIKRAILEKANKQIYETQDRVKKFQSALLLADTLQVLEVIVKSNGTMFVSIGKRRADRNCKKKERN